MKTHESGRAPHLGARATLFTLALVAALAAVAALTELGTPAVAVPASAGQDFGSNTCLNGFVWREAVPSDLVCVTPDVRTQTRQDNALAAARRSPNGGPFGPDTCLQGYVWREAVANDHVCVTPATREQARNDNLGAASRRNELRTTIGTYGSTPRYLVRTDRINVGRARVVLYNSATRKTIRSWSAPVKPYATAPGGLLSFKTGVPQCRGVVNAYFRVLDGFSGRKSDRKYVCATL